MKAARWHARRDVRVEEVDDPGPPGPGWVRLRVEACGICGTDMEEYRNGPVVVPTKPHPLSGRCAPLTLGHEPVGVVEAAGEGVGLEVGTHVAVEVNMHCGTCFWCRRHEYQLCSVLASLGQQADGALAEHLLAPAYMCAPYSDGASPRVMAFAEPLSVAVRAVRRAGVGPGSTVGIVGAGTLGLLALQVARSAGASLVVSVDHHESRRQLALQLGADAAVAPADAAQAGADLTGGAGFDVTVEVAGHPSASAIAIGAVRRGGRVVLLGVYKGTVPVEMMDLLLGEKEIVASLSHVYDEDFLQAVRLLEAGRVQVLPLVTDEIRLEDVVTGGFEPLLKDPARHLKVLVFPNGLPG